MNFLSKFSNVKVKLIIYILNIKINGKILYFINKRITHLKFYACIGSKRLMDYQFGSGLRDLL